MITQKIKSSQVINQTKDRRPRRERRIDILAERRRLKKAIKEAKRRSMIVDFDNITVTSHGNIQLLESFKLAIGLKIFLKNVLAARKGVIVSFRLFN